MTFAKIGVGVLAILMAASLAEAACQIKIDGPKTDSSVDHRPLVKGLFVDPGLKQVKGSLESAQVWVVVHPRMVVDYWVQPAVKMQADGHWSVPIYVGRPGAVDIGKQFEIKAVVMDPGTTLKEGDVLAEWPQARCDSDVINLTRK